jgi:hypothetical protein
MPGQKFQNSEKFLIIRVEEDGSKTEIETQATKESADIAIEILTRHAKFSETPSLHKRVLNPSYKGD